MPDPQDSPTNQSILPLEDMTNANSIIDSTKSLEDRKYEINLSTRQDSSNKTDIDSNQSSTNIPITSVADVTQHSNSNPISASSTSSYDSIINKPIHTQQQLYSSTTSQPSSSSTYPSASVFQSMRQEFESVLVELFPSAVDNDNLTVGVDELNTSPSRITSVAAGSSALEKIRIQFHKLHSALAQSHENERTLITKCRELNAEIVSNASKIQTALRLSLSDANTINQLKDQIEKAWKSLDAATEREKKAKEQIIILNSEILSLSSVIDTSTGKSKSVQAEKEELITATTQLKELLSKSESNVEEQLIKVEEYAQQLRSVEEEKLKKEKDILQLKEKYASQKTETQRQYRRAERLTSELVLIKETNEKKQNESSEREKEFGLLIEKKNEIVLELASTTASSHHLQHENSILKEKAEEAEKVAFGIKQKEMEWVRERESFHTELKRLNREEKNRSIELNALMKKLTKVDKEKELALASRDDSERYKNWIKDEMKNVLKNMESYKVEAESDANTIKELQTQVKRLTVGLHSTLDKSALQVQLVHDQTAITSQLEQDIHAHKVAESELRMKVFTLEKERERECIKANGWYTKYKESMDAVTAKELELHDMAKSLSEEKNKLKLQQTLYEQVRNDRNLFSRQQISSEDEMNEMRRKFKIMIHQIEQLKEEIATKDSALINEHFQYKRLVEELKLHKRKMAKRKEMLVRCDELLAAQAVEIVQLRKTAQHSSQLQQLQKRQYEDVIAERDIIGTQLIRRNDELALLYEKLRITNEIMKKGEIQYRNQLQSIQNFEKELKETKRRLAIKIEECRCIESLNSQVRLLSKDLLVERTKVKALSEELENPINVHRWRKLEGSDPIRFDLLAKIQSLQKRLIDLTQLNVENTALLAEKDELYLQAKLMLARQPGPEVSEMLSKYERSEREKNRQMRAMCAELNMLNAQIGEMKWEKEKMNKESREMKKKLIQHKKLNHQTINNKKEEESKQQTEHSNNDSNTNNSISPNNHPISTSPGIRIAGGGFLIGGEKILLNP